MIKNYSQWLAESLDPSQINEKLKIKIGRGKLRGKNWVWRPGGALTIDPMTWEQEVQTPEAEWDDYLTENESQILAKMSEASKLHWNEIKADPKIKGYAVVALEKFIESYPTYKWQHVFCDNEAGIKEELKKIPKAPTGDSDLGNTNGINMPIEFPMNGPSNNLFADNAWVPTSDFEARLNTEVLEPLRQIAESMKYNVDMTKPKFFLKSIEVHTSCSRYRNTGAAANMTFAELSKARNTAAKDFIIKKLAELGVLADADTVITQDWVGGNGDGSTGPNPPKGIAITKDGKESTLAKEDARGQFGSPLTDKTGYDKFKYCIAGIEIVANTGWSEKPEPDPTKDGDEDYDVIKIDVPTKDYGIGFFSRPKGIDLRFRLPKIEISGRLWRKHSGKYKKGKNWGAIKCPKW